MKFYLAPLEGITGHVYRSAYHKYFGEMDKYFIPFISPNQFGRLSSREKENILPEHNEGVYAVPQIMTSSAEDFIRTAWKLQKYGYGEVNLNLGCPSKTVVSKGRGSGFLAFPDKLNCFLEEIFEQTNMKISIKTRIGKESPEEFERLLEIYNKYPLEELIIHPRLQTDFYKNTPNWEVFGAALKHSKCSVCYNGDIFTVQDYEKFTAAFPTVDRVMLGRGILSNPGLVPAILSKTPLEKPALEAFHNQIYEKYQEILYGEKNVLFKMKELWFYMAPVFTNYEKYGKKIKKAEKLAAYEKVVKALFDEQEIFSVPAVLSDRLPGDVIF
ncbi:tRNA dihydrouridine synthase [Faecalicatena contorta]|uniref:tRNA-dihydrouridine synthase n=1 Tax=Faecalicatena contorta TaxID=39482 RepID=A0A315ZN85_9FIRM|nr:tRNA-dihydrouridine synthase family protein [Faecalicatena contorta]PWJ47031.1 tRNA-U20a,U20b-dihydrouridine synthase [Faecalicatena contorta]SUQ16243.1 tRNA-dihydrouridine synthase [Faecalicatena contorta]